MKAVFILSERNKPIIEIEPEEPTEAILLDAFIRYEANIFRVEVVREDDGMIGSLTLHASEES